MITVELDAYIKRIKRIAEKGADEPASLTAAEVRELAAFASNQQEEDDDDSHADR